MNIADMQVADRNLKLLAGDSFFVENFEIMQVTLEEVKDIGYTTYNQYLGILTFRVEDLIEDKTKELDKNLTAFNLILYSGDDELIEMLINALCFFLKEDKDSIKFHPSLGLVFGDIDIEISKVKIINAEIYDRVVLVIRYQNYLLSGSAAKGYNPADDKAKEIIEKIQRANDKITKKKRNSDSDDSIEFPDIVSAVSTKSNSYNKHNVWTLTMYQFYDEYKRLEAISSYETNVLAMVQGAQVELKHWASKLD